jgi:hypothetical protein
MLQTPVLEALTLVVLGGLFGWTIGKLPDKWIYAVLALAIVLVIVTISVS